MIPDRPQRDGGRGPGLYELSMDLSETTNLAAKHSEKVEELSALLATLRNAGRSRPPSP